MILLSHPTGNAFVRALLLGLVDAHQLHSFHTTLNFASMANIMPPAVQDSLLRRSFPLSSSKIETSTIREIVRLTAPKLGLSQLTKHEKGWASIDAICQDLDKTVSKRLSKIMRNAKNSSSAVSAVYCYEDSSLLTFQTAKSYNLKCFYDLPIAYWQTSRRLLDDEAERLPQWEPTLVGTSDSAEKLERKTQELLLSDVVICPSQFVLDSLPKNIKREKICIIAEFGTPVVPDDRVDSTSRKTNDRLRVLFAGSMSQRKGLADVFDAVKLLDRSDVELVVMGSPVAPMNFYRSQYPHFTYEPTRPNAQVLDLMRTCDVLVLPSIVEGRALVQQEAMSCRLPLIVTPNAGGADLIDEGDTGFLIPIRSPQKIAEKIAWFADHREQTREMGELAREKALSITWDSYRRKILDTILPIAKVSN